MKTKKQPSILINPSPNDKRCMCCGRHISELKQFGGPGDPLVGDFRGAKLVKTFRQEFPNYAQVGASWECRDCIILPDKEYWRRKFRE